MKGKKSFILYCDQREIFDQLSNEQSGKLIKHIFKYVNDEDPKSDDPLINLAFTSIKSALKRDLAKWDKQHKQRVEAGKKSAEVRKRNATSVNERSVSSTVSVSDSVNVNENNIDARKLAFKESLFPFVGQYKKETVKDFFEYWSEHGENDKKMRYEKEKSFSVTRRLSTWAKRDFNKTEHPEEEKGKGKGGVSMEELYNANN